MSEIVKQNKVLGISLERNTPLGPPSPRPAPDAAPATLPLGRPASAGTARPARFPRGRAPPPYPPR